MSNWWATATPEQIEVRGKAISAGHARRTLEEQAIVSKNCSCGQLMRCMSNEAIEEANRLRSESMTRAYASMLPEKKVERDQKISKTKLEQYAN